MELNDEKPLISIIILNYNAGKLLKECVNSIYESNYKNFEIIVVDNDSKDNSHIECREKFPLINSNLNRWRIYPTCQLVKFKPNNYYSHIHCEHDERHSNRIFAWMIYLNDIKEGGGTYFHHQNFTTEPAAGNLYIWPAGWTHMHVGVNAPYESKYTVTGWVEHF